MRARAILAALLAVPGAAACAFLLDFDELQRDTALHDASTEAAAPDGAAAGGERDAAADVNPCPDGCEPASVCEEAECTPEGCVRTHRVGVFPDGLAETRSADNVYRVTMTSRGDRFYASVLQESGGRFGLGLHGFGKDGSDVSDGPDLLEVEDFGGRQPVSAAGLVAPTPGLELLAYVAIGDTPSLPAQVYRLRFDLDLAYLGGGPAAQDVNYSGGRRLHPIAWQPPGGQAWGAWPGADGGVFLHTGSNAILAGEQATFGRVQGQVFALAPLAAGDRPGVLWLTDRVNAQLLGQVVPAPIGECSSSPNPFVSASSADSTVDGFWMTTWTRAGQGQPVSELAPVFCGGSGATSRCSGSLECPDADQLLPSVRNAVADFVTVQGDRAGRTYQVLVTPVLDSSARQAQLLLQLWRIDFNPGSPDAGADVVNLTEEAVVLASGAAGPSGEGPDWPAVSIVGPDRIGVAWIEPAADGSGDELHLERHRICFPED